MKKYIFIFVPIMLLAFCTPKQTESKTEKKDLQLKVILDKLIDSQPNLLNNDITKQIFSDSLTCIIQKYKGDTIPFLSEIPLEFEMMLEYTSPYSEHADKYVVKFGYGEIASKLKISENYKTTFQVFAIVPKDVAANLIQNKFYNLQGIFVDFANCSGSFELPSGKCFEDYPNLTDYDGNPYIDLGTFILADINFKLIE